MAGGEQTSPLSPERKTDMPAKLYGDRVVPCDRLIATNPKIDRKGDANPYTSLNGNMFTPSASIQIGDPPALKTNGKSF